MQQFWKQAFIYKIYVQTCRVLFKLFFFKHCNSAEAAMLAAGNVIQERFCTSILCLPFVTWSAWSFSYAAPSAWNSLPCWVRSSNTLTPFKSSLKYHLFRLYYWLCVCVCVCARATPSPKQPFSFLGRLAINSYLALCQQKSDSVACGSAWLTVHSGGWGYRVICVFPSSLQLKK